MFHSLAIIGTAFELNKGRFVEEDPLIQALYNLHLDIVRTEMDVWQDMGGTDETFAETYNADYASGRFAEKIA